MKINKGLLGFFLGVVLTGLFAFAANWGSNVKWQNEVVSRGYGYYLFNCKVKTDWLGNQPYSFHWGTHVEWPDAPKEPKPNFQIRYKNQKSFIKV